ncbi:alpha/beta hydrolase [Frankia sp. CNm7]|uniref:Alpha/beta hydrolase n=1 Tax=Frankia nepalensis TaxID=1836974 RepID=A0A937RNI6_9ACTN|nr:alpha/beta hydrolase [Frankia nepalensis]MBL7501858.1 alpha/beta hydrolase [Frankia nepalensis]MBL7513806.1 alpha/beta hydrolase [Frankia nepalensis]MBL7519979.1 alpha/beta hydrolase [Frankia nepalensis]MBL7629111.1 alpha/beta hydrolase [Frankia nepalensis]
MRHTDSGGDGEPIVLIHAAVFADWFVPFEREPAVAGLRRIRVTRTGYSDPAPAEPLSVADHAAECADLLRRLGIERARVLAHSSGCVVALQLALDHPELVGELVLVEPPLIDPLLPPEDRAAVAAVIGPPLGAAMGAAAQGDLRTAFDTFLAALCGPEHRSVIESALGRTGLERAERDCGYCFAGEVPSLVAWHFDEELARRIEQPVHLVAGGESPVFTHRLVDYLAAMLPDARATVIPGENHLLPLRAPAALASLLPAPAPIP